MTSKNQDQAADLRGPRTGMIAVVATSTSSAATDISAALPAAQGRIVDLIADVDVYYRWGAASETADETATTGANRVFLLPAGVRQSEKPTGTHLIHKAAASGTIRIAVTSD